MSVVVGQVAYGATVEEVLRKYPDLERKDIEPPLAYSAGLTHEDVHPG